MNIAKHVRRIQISMHIVDITSHIIMLPHQMRTLKWSEYRTYRLKKKFFCGGRERTYNVEKNVEAF